MEVTCWPMLGLNKASLSRELWALVEDGELFYVLASLLHGKIFPAKYMHYFLSLISTERLVVGSFAIASSEA